MRAISFGILAMVAVAVLSPSESLRAQTVICPAPPAAGEDIVRVTIGYFGEASREISEFCRLLAAARIGATLLSLGNLNDPATAQRVQAALEAGQIDGVWLSTAALGQLVSGSTIAAKILAVTDFLIVHVVARDPRIQKVTDPAFGEVEVRVPPGRSGFFADALFVTLGLPIRCLDLVFRCAEAKSDGEYKVFLDEPRPRAVVLVVPTLHRGTRDAVALILAQISPDYRLVEVPPDVVLRMRRIPGMVSATAIPRGYYGLGARRDVPPSDIPSAAAAMLLIGSTPAEVTIRVHEFTTRINQVILADAPRLPREVMMQSLAMVREMSAAPTRGRIALHPVYADKLRQQEMLLPGLPVAEAPTGPGLPPIKPLPPPAPTASARIQEFSARPPRITLGQRAQLCWVISGARAASIEPEIGPLSVRELEKGCRTVSPGRTTIYTLSATDPDGRTVQARATVFVTEPQQPSRLLPPRALRPGALAPAGPRIVSCTPVELVWTAVDGRPPITYTARLERLTAAGGWVLLQSLTTQQTRIDVSRFVGEGGNYRWNVQARDAAGVTSEPSGYLYFGCAPK